MRRLPCEKYTYPDSRIKTCPRAHRPCRVMRERCWMARNGKFDKGGR